MHRPVYLFVSSVNIERTGLRQPCVLCRRKDKTKIFTLPKPAMGILISLLCAILKMNIGKIIPTI